jgi:quercetin dioxygenase-like cupin family protein
MARRPDYVRIYSDADGETHFQDVFLGLTEPAASGETARIAVAEPLEVDRLMFRHVLEEASATVPHNAPRRQVIVILAGEIEVEVSDGEVRRFGPGDVTLVEDTTGKGHITRSLGKGERMTLVAPLRD